MTCATTATLQNALPVLEVQPTVCFVPRDCSNTLMAPAALAQKQATISIMMAYLGVRNAILHA